MSWDPTRIWYGSHPLSWLLAPLSWLYCGAVRLRRLGYRSGWPRSRRLAVPVVVVGNLTVGGTGKTPLVLRLVELLRERGWTPGIITRGYGGTARTWPQRVSPGSDPRAVGDEPVLLARRGGCLVVAGPDRVAAGELALSEGGCDILLSDDGLQHYRLARDLEIAVVDAQRGLGNRRCLPAGPLREPPGRLDSVDLVLNHGGDKGHRMHLVPNAAVNLRDGARLRDLAGFRGESTVTAVAGIGNPGRFFALLRGIGLTIVERPYPDHYPFSAADLADWPPGPVLMTEKDAVKCATFADADHWYVPVRADLDAAFIDAFFSKLEGLTVG